MAFEPQYSFWSDEDFVASGNAQFSDASVFGYKDGATKMVPDNYTGKAFSFGGGYWEQPSLWCIDNKLDSFSELAGDMGWGTGATGNLYFENVAGGQALVTEVISEVTGWYPGKEAYPTGASKASGQAYAVFGVGSLAAVDWPCENGGGVGASTTQMYEFDVRVPATPSDPGYNPEHGLGLTGILHPSFLVSSTNLGLVADEFILVEPRPDGLRIHGQSGAFLPADLSSKMRTVRVAIRWGDAGDSTTDLTVALDDGKSLFVEDCGNPIGGFNQYRNALWGCPPIRGGPTGPDLEAPPASTKYPGIGFYQNVTGDGGIAAFTGKTYWDNIRLNTIESIVKQAESVDLDFSSVSTETIYTDAFYPHPDAANYINAWIDYTPGKGTSVVEVLPQVRVPSGNQGGSVWQDVGSVDSFIVSGVGTTTSMAGGAGQGYIDLTNVPVYQGIENAIRFKVSATPNSSAPAEINHISVLAREPAKLAKFTPNWKLTSFPQNIFVQVDEASFYDSPIGPQRDDIILFENRTGLEQVSINDTLEGVDLQQGVTGTVKTNLASSSGLQQTLGYYDNPSWANYKRVENYTGTWYSDGFTQVQTGIWQGDLAAQYTKYPDDPYPEASSSGIATVTLSPVTFNDVDGQAFGQNVRVDSYNVGTDKDIGIALTEVSLTGNPSDRISVFEGVIQIPYGSGVWATIHDNDTKHQYFLDGKNYRAPANFSVAARLLEDYSSSATGHYLSLGVKPRKADVQPITGSQYSGWQDQILPHAASEFTVYSVTGYLTDHCYVEYEGISGHYGR